MADDLKDGGAAGADKGGAAGAAGADAGKTAAGTIVDAGAAGGADKGAAEAAAAAAAAGGDKGGAQPDWRSRMAGSDADALKRLARFPDEGALFKSYRALEARLSSGELKKALPEGATAEEITTWRKENGLPEKAEGYVEALALPNGLVLGEADKPIVAEFAAAALEGNIDPKAFNGLVTKYYAIQDQQRAKQETDDATFKQSSEDTLRGAWEGPAYRQNLTAISNMMAGWPKGLAERVLAGRTAAYQDENGKLVEPRKLGDDPAFVQQMAALALELNPAASLVPAGATNAAKGVADRIEEIRKFRREKPNEYEADKKMQAEELELIDAQLKIQKRAAA